MAVSDFKEHLKKGDIEGAIEAALNIDDSFFRLEALAYILRSVDETYHDLILSKMFETTDSIVNKVTKVKALALLASALYAIGKEKMGEHTFRKAISLADDIGYPLWQAEAYGYLAYYLALSDLLEDSLYYFNQAVEIIQSSREPYSRIVSFLSNLAKLIVQAADEITNERALSFYDLAEDIYRLIKLKIQADAVKRKREFVRDVLKRGSVAIMSFLDVGDIDKAIIGMRYLSPKERVAAMLEVAYWLFLHEREDLAKILLADVFDMILIGKIKPSDLELVGIAYKFMKLGRLDEALTIAGVIEDKERASGVLGNIALAYARFGKVEKAISIAEGIQNEIVKNKVLKALKGEEDVGHE
ncbi:hypothetical protein E3E31_01715 [Thermococcus sp. M39]|uniref:hypothetical protein n=1 Tax=unclassified Thermococcus TaxID=2627626 RepID=UPI00143A9966|nr:MULTISPECIES: hypothetical protein [unclassified Thermococcus]NJE07272.1 hypothetical protein [Thermococcus sp. M39]NJE12596.1 hypothetical protein [Thermococcus sp. LS2]